MVSAAPFCWLLSAAYVGVLYLLPQTRPRRKLEDNNNSAVTERQICALTLRLIVVSIISVVSVVFTLFILIWHYSIPYSNALHLVGLFPKQSTSVLGGHVMTIGNWVENSNVIAGEAVKVVFLTAILFLGPLFEYFYSRARDYRFIHSNRSGINLYCMVIYDFLSSWQRNLFCLQGARVYIVGPWTEEIVFRACIVGLTIGSGMIEHSDTTGSLIRRALIVTPMYFSLAHAHHAYEAVVTGESSLTTAILMALFQCAFTGIFGVYAAFVYIRTGSILAPCCLHSFCNAIGLPRLGGRVPGPNWVSITYYLLLFLGVILFTINLFPLTQSSYGLLQLTSAPN